MKPLELCCLIHPKHLCIICDRFVCDKHDAQHQVACTDCFLCGKDNCRNDCNGGVDENVYREIISRRPSLDDDDMQFEDV